MAAVAARSSLIGALLRTATPVNSNAAFNFLRGLSRDELECIADFQGAQILECMQACDSSPYRLLAEFFQPAASDRWRDADDRAHKTFVVLAWIELVEHKAAARTQSNRAAVA